jgi:hypothetical protein
MLIPIPPRWFVRIVQPLLLSVFTIALPLLSQEASLSPTQKNVAATHTTSSIELDGSLTDEAWIRSIATDGFIQAEPYQGEPSTEKTEVRIIYDDSNLYIAVYCHDADPSNAVISSLKEDFPNGDTDTFEVLLDTYLDRRNAFLFTINPRGAKRDEQISDEGRTANIDWDTVWDVRTRPMEDGWTAEIVIPFKSLSFDQNRDEQVWGINFARRIRRKNEVDYWSPVPRRYDITRVSLAGELHGLEGIERGRNLRVKPFVVSDFKKFARDDFDVFPDAGLDIKYSLTPSMTLDTSFNTDFSQVEVDEQQINLTRFPLFFPEKRDFFLENSGIFQFGDIPLERSSNRAVETQLFFSRRIGLSAAGEPIPIWGGGRLSGQVGKFGLGMLSMQTKSIGSEPGANFAVLRVKRNILSNSDIGGILLNRQPTRGKNFNRAFGTDANFRFGPNYTVNSYLAKTVTNGIHGQDMVGKISTQWRDKWSRILAIYTDIGDNFRPEMGFTERTGIRSFRGRVELNIRPPRNSLIREFHPHSYPNYVMDRNNRMLAKTMHYGFDINFHNGSLIELKYDGNFDRLDQPFLIRQVPPRVSIPLGHYHFGIWGLELQSDPSKMFSGTLDFRKGDFYSGERTTAVIGGTFRPNYRLSLTGRYTHNDVSLEEGAFTNHLVSSRVAYSFNTRMSLNALLQYNSDRKEVTSNIRFNFIHRPLSDIFLVFNEQRDVNGAGRNDRAVSVKYTHLIAF